MRDVTAAFRPDSCILVLGSSGYVKVAKEELKLTNVVTAREIFEDHPEISPYCQMLPHGPADKPTPRGDGSYSRKVEAVSAILILHDPVEWALDLQVLDSSLQCACILQQWFDVRVCTAARVVRAPVSEPMSAPVSAHTAQVCLDVLLHKQAAVSGLRRSDAVVPESYTSVPIIVSNSDFVFQGSYPVPRMAQGSFHIAL